MAYIKYVTTYYKRISKHCPSMYIPSMMGLVQGNDHHPHTDDGDTTMEDPTPNTFDSRSNNNNNALPTLEDFKSPSEQSKDIFFSETTSTQNNDSTPQEPSSSLPNSTIVEHPLTNTKNNSIHNIVLRTVANSKCHVTLTSDHPNKLPKSPPATALPLPSQPLETAPPTEQQPIGHHDGQTPTPPLDSPSPLPSNPPAPTSSNTTDPTSRKRKGNNVDGKWALIYL